MESEHLQDSPTPNNLTPDPILAETLNSDSCLIPSELAVPV